jgi:hypothetical protein
MNNFNSQFATQKLRQETSMTSAGAGMTPPTVNNPVTQDWYTTKNKKRPKKEEKDVEPKLAAGKAKVYMKDKWGWEDAPSIPNRPSEGGFIYKQLFEELSNFVNEEVSVGDFNHYRSALNDAYQELGRDGDMVGRKAVADADKSLENAEAAKEAIKKSKITPGNKSTYLKAIEGIKSYLSQPSKKSTVSLDKNYSKSEVQSRDFNVNKIWDFIESKPFNNPNYMPKFNTAEEIWNGWGPEEKEMYANFNWEDTYGNEIHRREKAALQRRANYDALAGLNENYSKFKTETKTRGKSDQFHQAVRGVKKKVQEINRLFEYVSRLKLELSEGEAGLEYKRHTEKALAKIKEMVSELNQNIKKFK